MIHPVPASGSGSFYDAWHAIEVDPNLNPAQKVAAQVALIEQWLGDAKGLGVSLLDHPEAAILPTPLGTFVTKFKDVTEVLERDDVFGVAAGYGERMAISTGAFMLGMDAGAAYDRESALIRLAMPASDLPAIRAWVRAYAEGTVASVAANAQSIDVAEQIGYRVTTGFVGQFLGVPGPNQDAWVGWQQLIGLFIFNLWTGGSPFREEASATGLTYQSYINDTIRQRWADIAAGAPAGNDLLSRLITRAIADPAGNLDEVAIRRNLGGLAIGSTMAPSGDIIFALDYLVGARDSDPTTYAMAVRAALDDDEDLLLHCVLEACRLGTSVPPTLFRVALSDYELAAGTDRAKRIPAGADVVLVPAASMMDADMVPDPTAFRIDRPLWTYMMFGEGMHQCFGREIGKILLVESARAVLRLPNVRRAPGAAGHIQRGTGLASSGYAAHLIFDFDGPPPG